MIEKILSQNFLMTFLHFVFDKNISFSLKEICCFSLVKRSQFCVFEVSLFLDRNASLLRFKAEIKKRALSMVRSKKREQIMLCRKTLLND